MDMIICFSVQEFQINITSTDTTEVLHNNMKILDNKLLLYCVVHFLKEYHDLNYLPPVTAPSRYILLHHLVFKSLSSTTEV